MNRGRAEAELSGLDVPCGSRSLEGVIERPRCHTGSEFSTSPLLSGFRPIPSLMVYCRLA